jgi:hypothetical protein
MRTDYNKKKEKQEADKAACLLYLVAKEEACEGDGLIPVDEAVVCSEPSEMEASLLQQCVEQVAPVGLLVARTCDHDDDDTWVKKIKKKMKRKQR